MTCRRRSSCAAAGSLRMSTCFMPPTWREPSWPQDRPGRINKTGGAHLRPGDGPEVSYAFIRDRVADFPIQVMCEVLGVSRSGYYAWANRPESARSVEDRVVAAEIRAAHEVSRGRYGSS